METQRTQRTQRKGKEGKEMDRDDAVVAAQLLALGFPLCSLCSLWFNSSSSLSQDREA